jgi:CheY-like chemotaxis protein
MKTILVVDDVPEVQELIRVTFEIKPLRVLTARTANQALQMALLQQPDLIIMDVVQMGDIDGYELCRRIKAEKCLRGVRVLFLTSHGQKHDRDAAYAAGADLWMLKPFSPTELISSAEGLLNARRLSHLAAS